MTSRLPEGTTIRVAGAGATRLVASVDTDCIVAGPTGHPALEPLVVASVNGDARLVPNATAATLETVLEQLEQGSFPGHSASPDEPGWTASLDDLDTFPTPEDGPLSVGHRRTTARCGWADPTDHESYREWGVVADADPESIRTLVGDAGLRGRGRTDDAADERIADRWETARNATTDSGEDPIVVVNANEVDDAVAGDHLLLESDPFVVLDGALATARAIGATDLVVYVGESSTVAAERAKLAGEALSSDIDDAPTVQVAAGPETFAAAEATMAIESLQGKERLEARRRPPGPEAWGLYGRPTLVHSARTFAQVRSLLAEVESIDSGDVTTSLPGTAADPGTRLVTVSGDVDAPATVELPTDAALSDALAAVDPSGKTKAYRVGGRFGGIARHVDLPVGSNALSGAGLGTAGGVERFGKRRCVLAEVGEVAAFVEDGNCGRCVPCREGSKQLATLLRDVYRGEYDASGIRELARVMRTTSLCSFGIEAPRPVLTALSEFENEVAAHADGRCPAGACEVGR